jgi:hypothetical protein
MARKERKAGVLFICIKKRPEPPKRAWAACSADFTGVFDSVVSGWIAHLRCL